MSVMRLRQLAPLVQRAGLRISRELGYQPDRSNDATAMAAKAGVPSAYPGSVAI
jgi:hypothetical protein